MKLLQTAYPENVHPILFILPNIILSLIIEFMKPGDEKMTLNSFEALCYLWHTLHYLVHKKTELHEKGVQILKNFCLRDEVRDKDNNMGIMLILYTILMDEIEVTLVK